MESRLELINGKYIVTGTKVWKDYIKRKFYNPKTKHQVSFHSLPKEEQKKLHDLFFNARKEEEDKKKSSKPIEETNKSSKHNKTEPSKERHSTDVKLDFNINREYGIGKMPKGSFLDFDDGQTPKNNPALFTGAIDIKKKSFLIEGESVPFSKLPKEQQNEMIKNWSVKEKNFRLPGVIPKVGPEEKKAKHPKKKRFRFKGKLTEFSELPKDTQTKLLKEYNTTKSEITQVDYNPKWNPKYPADNGVYCTYIRKTTDKEGKEKEIKVQVYTIECTRKSNRLTFLVAEKAAQHWDNYRSEIDKSLTKDYKPGEKYYAAACAFGLQMTTACRIGNKKETEKGTFGSSTLQKRHMKFLDDGSIKIEYYGKGQEKLGQIDEARKEALEEAKKSGEEITEKMKEKAKDKSLQTKIIRNTPKNKVLIDSLKIMHKRCKDPKDFLFTYDKEITGRDVNKINLTIVQKEFKAENKSDAKEFAIDLLNAKTSKQKKQVYEDWGFEDEGLKLSDVDKYQDKMKEIYKKYNNHSAGSRLISNGDIGGSIDENDNSTGYLREVLKSGMNSHCVRHVHANRIFLQELYNLDPKKIKFEGDNFGNPKPSYVSKIMRMMNEAITPASKQLGNTVGACRTNYINPALMVKFTGHFGIEPKHYPKTLKSLMVLSGTIIFGKAKEVAEWSFNHWEPKTMADMAILMQSMNFDNDPRIPKTTNDKERLLKMIRV